MFDINKHPRLCLKLNKKCQSVRLIYLMQRQPMLRLVVFIGLKSPFLRICLWHDRRQILPDFKAYMKKEIELATDATSKYFTYLDWHQGEEFCEITESEALQHFVAGSHGATEFSRRFTYYPPESRFLCYLRKKFNLFLTRLRKNREKFYHRQRQNINASV